MTMQLGESVCDRVQGVPIKRLKIMGLFHLGFEGFIKLINEMQELQK